MASTYLDLLAKFQEQGLDTLKQAQSAYVESLTSTRAMVEKLPTLPKLPVIDGVPTIEELTELNTEFLDRVVAQQKAFAKQLADVFAPLAAK
jgi:hypothetical protein